MSALDDLDSIYREMVSNAIMHSTNSIQDNHDDQEDHDDHNDQIEISQSNKNDKFFTEEDIVKWMTHTSIHPKTGKRIYRGSTADICLRKLAMNMGMRTQSSCLSSDGKAIKWVQSNIYTSRSVKMAHEIPCRGCGDMVRLYFVHDHRGRDVCPICKGAINCKYICTKRGCMTKTLGLLIRN